MTCDLMINRYTSTNTNRLSLARLACALLLLSSCGGGKGCAYTSDPDAQTDIHVENIDINLGIIDGRHVEDGRIIVRMTIPDDAKLKLQTYFDRAAMKEGFEPQLAHIATSALVRKSEANLPFGSKNVKDWGEYFCSDLRFFRIKDGEKQNLGAQTAARVIGLRNSTSVHSEEFRRGVSQILHGRRKGLKMILKGGRAIG